MERFKALMQAFGLAWPWFGCALLGVALSLLFGLTVNVPAKVISVTSCTYLAHRFEYVPGSQALVQTADGRDHTTPCEEGQPFTIGGETELGQNIFGGDAFSVLYPAVTIIATGVCVLVGVVVIVEHLHEGEPQQRGTRRQRQHQGGRSDQHRKHGRRKA